MLASTDISRRQFLRGDIRGRRHAPCPPWALAGGGFERLCSSCDACLKACPESILVRSPGGLPTVDFQHGACTFCGACADSCDTGALARSGSRTDPWTCTAHLEAGCLALRGISCASCQDACESRAIRMAYGAGGIAVPRIHRASCTGCGACVGVCPADAIEVY